MKNFKKSIALIGVLILIFALTSCGQAGQTGGQTASNYPTKPITVLQGFKAGGGSDQLAQLTQPFLQKILGQSFVNQYIPGATGAIAWTQLANSTKNDGYTISITNTPMVMTDYIMNPEVKYSVDQFDALANIVTDPGIIVVSKNSKFKTFQDLFDYAKANPGKLTVGNSGIGGDDFFTTLLFEKATGLKVQMVPFDGDGPSWQAAAADKIDVSFTNLGVTYQQIQAGNLIPLALFSENRIDMVPDVPTVKELGYNVVAGSSRGYSAPKGLPADVKAKLIDAFSQMAKDPAFIDAAKKQALILDVKTGDDYTKFLKDQETEFKGVWDQVKDQYSSK